MMRAPGRSLAAERVRALRDTVAAERIHVLGNTVAAEWVKLRGLPAVLVTMLGTVGAAIVLTALVAAAEPHPKTAAGTTVDATQIMLRTIQFLQVGPILIGVLAVATEYAGSQIRTTLAATPARTLLLAGKAVAYVGAAAITSATALGATTITLALRSRTDISGRSLLGGGLYLVLIGLLGFALAVLLRSLIPPLATMLGLVLIVSPLLKGFSDNARYLPGADVVLTPGTDALALLGWITVVTVAATTAFHARDA
jgi:hypothetical protein